MALDLSQEIIQATTPSQVVNFDKNTPTTVGVVFTPDIPTTTDVLYVSSVNASTWIYNGSSYVTYTAPVQTSTTPFYLMGTTIDAQGNKTASIQHNGYIKTTVGFIGNGYNITSLNSGYLQGIIPTANLGSGTADNTKYLRGDNTWQTIDLSGYTPTSRTLTIQGTNQDLSSNRSFNIIESLIIAVSDETTALTTGTEKVTFRMPYAFTLTDVRASLTTAGGTSGTTTINVKESGTTIFSTKVTIDYGAKTSTTASTQRVISDSSLADDSEITIDIDAVTGAGTEKGLKVYLIGYKS